MSLSKLLLGSSYIQACINAFYFFSTYIFRYFPHPINSTNTTEVSHGFYISWFYHYAIKTSFVIESLSNCVSLQGLCKTFAESIIEKCSLLSSTHFVAFVLSSTHFVAKVERFIMFVLDVRSVGTT